MRSIIVLATFLLAQIPLDIKAQYALGDGRGLERDLKQPQAPLRDPLIGMQRRGFPLTDGLGGQRFDDRFVRDGLQFAPEFTHGNSIYSRSLIFDYLGYSGWDLRAGRSALTRPEDRFDQIKTEKPSPTQRYSPPRDSSVSNRYPNSQRIKGRIDTKVPSNRMDTNLKTSPTDLPRPPQSRSVMQPNSPTPKTSKEEPEIEKTPAESTFLSAEQMEPIMVKVLNLRIQRRREEKSLFGNIQDRNLSEDFWERRGLGNTKAISLVGLSPAMRFEEKISKLTTENLILVAEKLTEILEKPSERLSKATKELQKTLSKEP